MLGDNRAKAATLEGNPLVSRTYPTDVDPSVFVSDFTLTQGGLLSSVLTYGMPGSLGYTFDAYVLSPAGVVLYDSGPLTVGSAGVNTFGVTPVNVAAGDIIAHFGQGVPLDIVGGSATTYAYPASAPAVGQTVPLAGWNQYVDPGESGRTYSLAVGVPDGGMTSMLLGMCLAGLSLVRRTVKK